MTPNQLSNLQLFFEFRLVPIKNDNYNDNYISVYNIANIMFIRSMHCSLSSAALNTQTQTLNLSAWLSKL